MEILTLLVIGIVAARLIAGPSVALWRVSSRPGRRGTTWPRLLVALFVPWPGAFAFVVLVWLPGYSGECGGWLGETTPCSGFGEYVAETLHWAAMSTAVPGLIGVLLGLGVLLVRGLARRRSRSGS